MGAVAGLFNLIPLIGPFIGAVPAIFIAFTTQSSEGLLHLQPGWPLAIGAAVALLIVQQIDNHIISPNVVSRTVKLHPLTVMLGLLVGGTLLGLWGMILAVPVIAATKILALHVWDTRMHWPPGPPADGAGPGGNGSLRRRRRGPVRRPRTRSRPRGGTCDRRLYSVRPDQGVPRFEPWIGTPQTARLQEDSRCSFSPRKAGRSTPCSARSRMRPSG